jgi:hypothetical protein
LIGHADAFAGRGFLAAAGAMKRCRAHALVIVGGPMIPGADGCIRRRNGRRPVAFDSIIDGRRAF